VLLRGREELEKERLLDERVTRDGGTETLT
jgi:hypothetical protein